MAIKQKPRLGGRGNKNLNRDMLMSLRKRNINVVEFHEILPMNDEAELALLNQLLSGPEAVDRVRKFITPEDFRRLGARQFFERICEFRDSGRDFTPSLILASFQRDPNFERFEDMFFKICDVYTGGFARGFANILIENSIRRELIKFGEQIIVRSFSVRPDIDSIISFAENTLGRVKERWGKKESADAK